MRPPADATARFAAARGEPHLILASASPRRQQILSHVGVSYTVVPSEVDERPLASEAPEALATRLAQEKARVAAAQFPDDVALAADTVVALGIKSLGKPSGPAEAIEVLQQLRGRSHRVITAVATARVQGSNIEIAHRASVTEVWMRAYSDDEIRAYVASGDPLDKAGGYAIQHAGFRPVERFEGCYLNVVGLPLPEVLDLLREAGLGNLSIDRAALEPICPGCRDLARLPISDGL